MLQGSSEVVATGVVVRRRPAAFALSTVLALAVAGIAFAGPAGAGPHDWGYTGGSDPVRAPDSRDHWHCKTNFDVHQGWLDSAVEQLDAQTVMWRQDASSCTSLTDVVWIKTGLNGIDGGDTLAKTTCVAHVSWGVCEQAWTLIDQPKYFVLASTYGASDPATWYSVNLQKSMRHEVGHTAGLHDRTGSLDAGYGAMNAAVVPNGTPNWLTYLAYRPFHEDLIDGNV